jgi:predicted RNase H-like nuclease (RuvC/YqgF family)
MTELERMLKDTLTRMEQDLIATQRNQGNSLHSQQCTLENHTKAIRQLGEAIGKLQTEQEESARHLQRLSDIHANLEPLLSRLSGILNGK